MFGKFVVEQTSAKEARTLDGRSPTLTLTVAKLPALYPTVGYTIGTPQVHNHYTVYTPFPQHGRPREAELAKHDCGAK